MADITDLITEIQRLHIADDEVLVVRPKGLGLDRNERDVLQANLRRLSDALGWSRAGGPDRIVVVDRDLELTVVKAEQMGLVG